MPYNALLGPDKCYGVDDGGVCENCGEQIDSGRCECTDEQRESPEQRGCTCPISQDDCTC